jgi:hypothetical protein
MAPTTLLLHSVVLVVVVVDIGAQILSVETSTEVGLIDLLVMGMRAS